MVEYKGTIYSETTLLNYHCTLKISYRIMTTLFHETIKCDLNNWFGGFEVNHNFIASINEWTSESCKNELRDNITCA